MKLSVIIPFYNLERYARPCLESVLAASSAEPDVRVECICVDDGSTDSTSRILDEFAAKCRWMRVIHQPNGGEGSARNAGLAAATGDWLAFLDGDDVWLPGILSRAAALTVRHPDADIVSFRLEAFEGEAVPAETAGEERLYDTAHVLPSDVILRVGVVPTFFRRSVFGDIRFGKLSLGADRLCVSACLMRAKSVVLSSACVYGYRMRATSMARAAWSARKISSMLGYACGAMENFRASGKRLGRAGVAYHAEILTRLAAKYVARAGAERAAAQELWMDVLRRTDPSWMPLRHRLLRRWYLLRRGIFHMV